MTKITKIVVVLAGLLHLVIFAMESVFFMDERIYSRFLVASPENAEIVSLFAFNQGWYNLFLAIAALAGALLTKLLPKNVGASISMYACLSMLAAATVLALSAPILLRAAVTQGLFPLIALLLFVLSHKKTNQ